MVHRHASVLLQFLSYYYCIFPQISTALRFCLTLPSRARSFNKLKLIEAYLRLRNSQEGLNRHVPLSIEHELVDQLDFIALVHDFVKKRFENSFGASDTAVS